jgi:hypothetical protein
MEHAEAQEEQGQAQAEGKLSNLVRFLSGGRKTAALKGPELPGGSWSYLQINPFENIIIISYRLMTFGQGNAKRV